MRHQVQWLPLLLLAAGCESLLDVDFDQAKLAAAGSGGLSGSSGQSGAGGKGAQGGAPTAGQAGQGGASGAGQGGAGAQGGMGAQGGAGAEGGVGSMSGTSGQAGVSGGGVGGAGQGGVGAMSGASGQGGMTTGGSGGLGGAGAGGEPAAGGAGMSGAGQGGGGSAGAVGCSGVSCKEPLTCLEDGPGKGYCGCTAKSTLCRGGKLYQCSDTGSFAFQLKKCFSQCISASSCDAGCKANSEFCHGQIPFQCDPDGQNSSPVLPASSCNGELFCNVREGKATCDQCVIGEFICRQSEQGDTYDLLRCDPSIPNLVRERQCKTKEECEVGTYTGECPLVCQPNQSSCTGNVVHQCSVDGRTVSIEDCSVNSMKCIDGTCKPPS